MQITGARPKVDTVGIGDATDAPGETQSDAAVEDYFENAFGGAPAGNSSAPPVGNPDPIDDYTFGDIQGGRAVADENADVSVWITNFPPSLDEIIAGNENAMGYLDLIMQRYEQAQSDLRRLRDTFNTALAGGTLSISEAEDLTYKKGLITQALARCDSEIQKVTAEAGRQETLYIDEIRGMKDLDNNGWVGRPRANGSYYVTHNPDGTTTFYDPKTRRAIPKPLMDPEYAPQITENGSLEILDAESAHDMPTGETVDLHLRLTPEALTNFSAENIYQAPIDIGIPEYIWVEKKGDGEGEEPFEMEFNSEAAEDKMVLYDGWSDEGGLHQDVPADVSRYMQVQVTDVKIHSVDSGKKDANGRTLYDHVVEFYNGEYLISRMQIEGFEGDGPGSARTEGGGNYVAASSVGLSIHGSKRASPVKLDASGVTSTAHHRFENVATKLDIRPPSDPRGAEIFNDTLSFFDTDGGARDAYVEADLNPGDVRGDVRLVGIDEDGNETSDSAVSADEPLYTGIFVRDIRGDITGTNFGDVIKTDGINELSAYAQEHLPDDRKEIKKGDAFYSNRVTGGSGNNIVVAGRGDNYIFDASLAWVEGGGSDQNFITTPEIRPNTPGAIGSHASTNPSTFVHVNGGSAHIVNPDEAASDTNAESDAQDEAANAVAEIIDAFADDDSGPEDTELELRPLFEKYGLRLEDFAHRDEINMRVPGSSPVEHEGDLKWDWDLNDPDDSQGKLKDAIIETIEKPITDGYRNDYYETISGTSSYTNPNDEDIHGNKGSESMTPEDIMGIANDPMQLWYEELTRVPEVDENTPQISWDEVMGASTELDNEMNGFFGEMFGGMDELFGESGSTGEETI